MIFCRLLWNTLLPRRGGQQDTFPAAKPRALLGEGDASVNAFLPQGQEQKGFHRAEGFSPAGPAPSLPLLSPRRGTRSPAIAPGRAGGFASAAGGTACCHRHQGTHIWGICTSVYACTRLCDGACVEGFAWVWFCLRAALVSVGVWLFAGVASSTLALDK